MEVNGLMYELGIFRGGCFIREREMVTGWHSVTDYVRKNVWDVYNSVYGFESEGCQPVVNRIVIDIDDPERVREADEILSEYRRTVVFSGRGFHIYLHTVPCLVEQSAYLRGADRLIKRMLRGIVDDNVFLHPHQMIRSVGSKNSRTGLFCCSVPNPYDSLEQIKKMARNPEPKVHVQPGKLFVFPAPIHRPNDVRVSVPSIDIDEWEESRSLLDIAVDFGKPVCNFVRRKFSEETVIDGMKNYKARFYLLLFLRDCFLLTQEECANTCAKILNREQIQNINRKGQLTRVYSSLGYNFNCGFMRGIGACPSSCDCIYYEKQQEFIERMVNGEMSEDDAEISLARIHEQFKGSHCR